MKNIVFLTGSGISQESGIPTFRDSGSGLWNNYKVEDVADINGYIKDPEYVLNFYNECRNQIKSCKPNNAHKLIAELEKDANLNVTVITQNVDNLHEQAGSTNVIHLHGDITKGTSSDNPNDKLCIVTLQSDIKLGDKAYDGSQLRPYIVWFGESVPNYEVAKKILHDADILIVVGTSLQVYPAALLIFEVPADKQIYIVDPNEVKFDDQQAFEICPIKHINKKASEGMKDIYDILVNKK